MTAEIDVYQDCLCGSGKKLKFCCLPIAGDIIKIMRFQESGQYTAALTALEALDKKPIRAIWSRAWVKSAKASLLGASGKWDEAKRLVEEVLAELPEHPFSRGLMGFIVLQTEGYRAARPVLYEALQATSGPLPLMTSELASAVGSQLLQSQHVFAAHQYMSVAVAFNPQQERNQELLRKFKETIAISYLLRSEYPLRPISGPDDAGLTSEFLAARRVFNIGCFNLAAQAFRKLARQNSHNAALWYNIGICDASAGEEALAVRAFREAAAVEPDFETAVEYAALAQAFSWSHEVPQQRFALQRFRVSSVARLLTQLDQQPDFARISDLNTHGKAAIYRVLDRPGRDLPWETLSSDDAPSELSVISVDEPGSEPNAMGSIVHVLELENLNLGRRRLEEIAGSEIEFLTGTPVDQVQAEELAPLYRVVFYPEGTPRATVVRLTREHWQQFVFVTWPGLKLAALNGKTPLEAAGDPELKTKLAGAVLAFHGFAATRNVEFDETALRGQLGLPPVATLEIAPDADTDELSTLQLRRLRLDTLAETPFLRVAHRSMGLRQWALDYRGYVEFSARCNLPMKTPLPVIYLKLAGLCSMRLNKAEALAWIAKAKDAARAGKASLTEIMSIEFQEVSFRAVDPHDPLLPELIQRIWRQYLPKLPEYRDNTIELFEKLGLKEIWQSIAASDDRVEALAGAGSGVWTPESATPTAVSKLWIPGQD